MQSEKQRLRRKKEHKLMNKLGIRSRAWLEHKLALFRKVTKRRKVKNG